MDDALERKVAAFTNEEKEMMASFLRRKKEYEQQVMEMHLGYCAIYNSRNPILSLPNEVTCLIFDYAQLTGGLDEFGQKRDDWHLMEVVVSHVCQRWRSIALGCRSLWTKFHYSFEDTCVPLERFEVYLRRSGTLPLYFWFNFRPGSYNPLNSQLLDQAIDHAARWKQFILYVDREPFWVLECVSRLQNLHAPFLECLVLSPGLGLETGSLSVINLDPAIFRGGAPNLKFCLLDDYAFLNCIPPLWNITTLQIHIGFGESTPRIAPQVVVDLLSLPSLQHLSLIGEFPQPTTPVYEIKMPNLQRLLVFGFNGMWFYLPYIRAPRLEFLVIRGSQFSSDTSGTRAPSPDQCSFPSLRKLWISDSDMDEGAADRFIQLTSEAANVLIASSKPESFFGSLCSNFDAEKLWPRLTVMTASIRSLISIEPYVSFARSRSTPFTFRLHHKLLSRWKKEHREDAYRKLEEFCRLEPISEKNWPIDAERFWPIDMKAAPDNDPELDDPSSVGLY